MKKAAPTRKGIQFVTDEKGKKTAVLIDLKKYGDLWEDFYDALIAKERLGEATVPFETVEKNLRKAGKLRG